MIHFYDMMSNIRSTILISSNWYLFSEPPRVKAILHGAYTIVNMQLPSIVISFGWILLARRFHKDKVNKDICSVNKKMVNNLIRNTYKYGCSDQVINTRRPTMKRNMVLTLLNSTHCGCEKPGVWTMPNIRLMQICMNTFLVSLQL